MFSGAFHARRGRQVPVREQQLDSKRQQLIEELKKQKEAAIKSFDDKLAKLGYDENHAPKRSHHRRKTESNPVE
jgi:hypothetical protein